MDYITILCLINLVVTLYNILYSEHTDCYMEEMCNIHCKPHHDPHEHLLHFNNSNVSYYHLNYSNVPKGYETEGFIT